MFGSEASISYEIQDLSGLPKNLPKSALDVLEIYDKEKVGARCLKMKIGGKTH